MRYIPQNLYELRHFRDDARVQFKEEVVNGVEVVIPCYMIADADFWKMPYATELRGHVYHKGTGELMAAAFHKFFNVGERAETQYDKIDWEHVGNRTFDKMDGSMINAVVIASGHGAGVHFKTKKSFYSDVAVEFTRWFWKQPQAEVWAADIIELWKKGLSPIFEFYHPDWQVVLNYGSEPKCWWLNTRNMEDGSYIPFIVDEAMPGMERAPTEMWSDFKGNLLHVQQTTTGVEGWIAYDGVQDEFYKVKTKWYLEQHRVRTQMRERDVAEMAAKEQLDDVKSLVSAAGLDLGKIEAIEKSVSKAISDVRETVEFVSKFGHERLKYDVKEMALYAKGHEYFGMIMQKFRGKEPDYVGWFLRNKLPEYTLKNVYNEKF